MVKIKICGLTRIDDACLAVELGAWAIGLVFYPKSPRYLSPERAEKLVSSLIQRNLRPKKIVGVFVNETLKTIEEIADRVPLDIVQLHGEEAPEFIDALEHETIKAFRLQKEEELQQIRAYDHADYLLLDAFVQGVHGGTGQLANWKLAKLISAQRPLFLSGGIGPDNLQEAIREVQPMAIDLSSSVEESPGIKSHKMLRLLFKKWEEL